MPTKKQTILSCIALFLALDISQSLYQVHKAAIERDKEIKLAKRKRPAIIAKIPFDESVKPDDAELSLNPNKGTRQGIQGILDGFDFYQHYFVNPTLSGMYTFKPLNYFLFGLSCKTCQGSWMAKYFPAYIDPVSSRAARERIASEQEANRKARLEQLQNGSLWDQIIELFPFSVSRNCRRLSMVVLKSSFEDAPKNNGDYVSKVLTPNIEFYRYTGDTYKTFSRYVMSIDNNGHITEGWWTSPRNNQGHMYRDISLDRQSPNFPEPVMKSNSGIVCNLAITTAQDSKNFLGEDVSNVIIWATGKSAVLSQDSSGYKVKY